MRVKILLSSLFLLGILLSGCGNVQNSTTLEVTEQNQQSEETAILKIYTTLFPLEDFTKKIGGDYVEVKSIMPPGADAHTYEPTTKEMINMAEADAFIYNGLGLEGFANKVSEALKNENTVMVEAAHGVEAINHSGHAHEHEHEGDDHDETAHEEADYSEEEHDEFPHEEEEHDHDHGDYDPHVWIDPYRSITLAENIKNALVSLKPEAEEEFEQNYQQLVEQLHQLDEEFHQLVETKSDPKMIVSHAGYGYWEESYGIKQIAVTGLSPTNEPSQQDLEKIIEIANEEQIKYIVYEQNITPVVADVIRKEIQAEPLRLHNLAVLTDEDIENGEDYFSLMRKNLETLKVALQ